MTTMDVNHRAAYEARTEAIRDVGELDALARAAEAMALLASATAKTRGSVFDEAADRTVTLVAEIQRRTFTSESV